jgi:glycine betaine/proline transport system substrate-binding protein
MTTVYAKEKITFADAGWASMQFHNEVARTIVEKGYGYQTDVVTGSLAVLFLGLKRGDVDVYMEAWTNDLRDIYYPAIEEGSIIQVSINYNDNAQGFYVPTYVIEGDKERNIEPMAPDLKTVKDLKDYWHIFEDEADPSKGRIYGSPPTWTTTDEILRKKLQTYGLNKYYNYFSPGSGSALQAVIVGAYEKGEPIVAYYWEPTWVMGMLDLTLLEEAPYSDKKWLEDETFDCKFKEMDVTIAVNKDLPEKTPAVVEFLSNYRTTSDIASEALSYMMENDVGKKEAAYWFLKNRKDLWTEWVPQNVAKKVINAIS